MPTQSNRRPREVLAVFVACRDSAAEVEKTARRMRLRPEICFSCRERTIASCGRSTTLSTLWPRRVRLLILDDVEYLLPPGQRQPERVRRHLIGLKARHSHRGFHVVAHMWKAKPVGFRREILP